MALQNLTKKSGYNCFFNKKLFKFIFLFVKEIFQKIKKTGYKSLLNELNTSEILYKWTFLINCHKLAKIFISNKSENLIKYSQNTWKCILLRQIII